MEQFKVLTDREHVLARTNVYLGSTLSEQQSGIINYEYQTKVVVPALVKMIEEIYQNSVDEYIRTNGKFATKIDISFEPSMIGTKITIKDNGRGIPQDVINDKPRPVLAWTELRAGSNFDDSKRVGAGTNGMGAALTNIFSTSFVGITCDGQNRMTVNCSANMENVSFKIAKSSQQGTSVEFTPDYERLGVEDLSQDHISVIRDRIENLAICYKGIQFTFNGEKIKFKSLKDIAKKFSEHSISLDEENVSLVIAPSGDQEEFRCLSYMNGIYIKNAGTHVDVILSKVIESLRTVIKKKYKFDVLPNQIKQHLLLASWISKFPALRFDSQSKERCTNTVAEVTAFFGDIDFDAIAKKVINTPEIIDPIVEAQIRKKEAQEAAELRKKNKDVDKANLRKISKFTDATQKEDRENCMLFVCEGDCLEESTEINVYTTDGIEKRMIKDINIGDQVLTHKNRLRKVAHTFSKVDHFIEIKTSEGIIRCSKTHRLFVYNTVFDKFEIISAEQLNAKTHKLIKSKPSLSIHASLITEITHSEELYDLLIVHHDGEIYSTYEHKFMVLDIETEEYIFLTAKELIPFKHCFAFI